MNSHKAGFLNVYATHDPQSTDFICEIGPAARQSGEANSNALLICAAPDLLHAAERALIVLENPVSVHRKFAAIAAIADLRAAITKALPPMALHEISRPASLSEPLIPQPPFT